VLPNIFALSASKIKHFRLGFLDNFRLIFDWRGVFARHLSSRKESALRASQTRYALTVCGDNERTTAPKM
jgi:hypothetical protein